MIIKVILDKRRPTSDGKYTVRLSFANMGKTVYSSLNIYVNESEFDSENQILFTNNKKTQIENKRHNSYIISETNRANNLLNSLQLSGRDRISPSRFKEMFLRTDKQEALSFNDFFRSFIEKKTGRTAELYAVTLLKVERRFGKNIYFDDINYSWLESFDQSMQKDQIKNNNGVDKKVGLEINSRSVHLRNIRAVINNAINNDVISLELYPFRRFKIKNEETRKRSLTLEQLRTLFNYEGKEHLNWARDVSKLIFFMIGINVKDLYDLKGEENGYTYYVRAKTKRHYGLKVEPEMKALFEQFKGNKSFLCFPETMAYRSLGVRINRHLKVISEECKLPKITTYSLRHTWATLAAKLEIPKETISAALGHGPKNTTDIYIDFDRTKIDEANRKVIDHVLNIKREDKKERKNRRVSRQSGSLNHDK